ncbi:SDR family oxidoreductase [Actinomadura rayongensis]|uniref:NAD(P)H-binding protein n=1 Tax=Actinomadura rayongensis TaxID=1429076 RepID=A0A6I4VZY4_9ACTN|nr:NAD(P)H-binding protein [Actinomadura rayongensis]MXQ62813.1 NAD(P)H-binding protein [Actinomadura rayongensis]
MYLIAGATGNVGRHVVTGLVAANEPVRALTRDPAAAGLPAGAAAVATADAAADATLDGVTGVFVHAAVFHGDLPGFLAAAKAHGVKRVVTLSSLASVSPGNPIGDHHLALERQIEDSGLEWVHLRPGAFAVNTLAWAGQIRGDGVVRLPYPDSHTNAIHERDIADVAVRAFLTDDLVGARPVLTGPESLRQDEQVRLIGAAIGRELTAERIDAKVARDAMVGGFVTEAMADWMLEAQAEMVDNPAPISPETERILGRPGRTFADWAVEHAADFA